MTPILRGLRKRGGLQIVLTAALLITNPEKLFSSPAPAPALKFPANAAQNIPTDLDLGWTWTDELLINGSFEQGFVSGWSLDAGGLAAWIVFTNSDNSRFAGTSQWYQNGSATMSQDVYVPPDATSVQLIWKDVMYPSGTIPQQYRTRLIISAVQADACLQVFEDVDGHQPEYTPLQWVSRSADLLALAGQSFQLSVQCRRYSPGFAIQCWAEVDAFSLKCVHPSTPEFQVYLCKSGSALSQSYIGSTTDLGFSVPQFGAVHLLPMASGFRARWHHQSQFHRLFQDWAKLGSEDFAGASHLDRSHPAI